MRDSEFNAIADEEGFGIKLFWRDGGEDFSLATFPTDNSVESILYAVDKLKLSLQFTVESKRGIVHGNT